MEINNDTTNSLASTDSNSDSDVVNCSTAKVYFGPVQSPEKRLIASHVVRRRALKSRAADSPLGPSIIHTLPAPLSLQEKTDTPDEGDERSDEDADEIYDVAAHLSREDTPENDPLGQNDPSSILASRIMRASDNPSPPPRAHPNIYFGLLIRDGETPIPDISAPPSPFRPINLRESLNHFAATECALPPEPPAPQASSHQHPPLQDSAGNISQPDLISFESCSILVKMHPTEPSAEGHPRDSPAQTLPSSATSNTHDFILQSPECPPVISSPSVNAMEHSSDSLYDLRQGRVPADTKSGSPYPSSSSPLIANSSTPAITKEGTRSPVRRSARLSVTPRPLQITHSLQPSQTSKLKGKSSTAILTPEREISISSDEQMFLHRNADTSIQRSVEEKEARRSRRRGLNGKPEMPNLQRELGSLSPQSAHVLTRLLPSERSTLLTEGPSQPQPELSFGSLDLPPSTPQKAQSTSQQSILTLTTVHRPLFVAPTPIRPSGSSSLHKFSVTVDDVSRTPARRVPIQDAFVRGSAYTQNAMLLSAKRDTLTRLNMRGPAFSRPALDDPSRSPAKRILIADLNTPIRTPARPSAARARSASAEPKTIFPQAVRSRSVDPSPRAASLVDSKGKARFSSKPRSGSTLPFPLVGGQKAGTDLPHSIPEEAEGSEAIRGDLDVGKAVTSSSPLKSSLKQPSTGSRIPRINSKPYARPQANKASRSAATKLPALGTGPRARTLISVVASNGSSSSEEPHAIAPPPRRNPEGKSLADPTILSTLKRKRGAEETVISPPVTRPVVVRQVVPGMLGGKYAPKAALELPIVAPSLSEPSPRKPPGPIKFRKVEPGVISSRYALSKPTTSDYPPADDSNSILQRPVLSEGLSIQPPPPNLPLPAPPERKLLTPLHDVIEPQGTADASSRYPIENRSRGRRTSRRKPAAQHVSDVFDTSTSNEPLQPRRSRRSEGDGFMGMSAYALQALTTSNTTKNQQVFAKLEREVIRKDGIRPESPTVKVRTISQKQREARDRQRHERAQRRAQRSEDGLGVGDGEGASELGDQSMIGINGEDDDHEVVVWAKHRRGPGEAEDYETPDRPDRSVKRLRFGGDVRDVMERKRVKWHHGLSTEIYLDEVHLRPNSWAKDFFIEKSCLAPTSKNLRLDTLGNLMDTEHHPLTELDPENIVVKKYVYDNDIEVVKEVIPPKITRSKSKKTKN